MKGLTRFLWVGVGAGVVGYVGLTLWLGWSAIFFPYALDYGEGDVFWFTHKLALGQNIYTTLGGPPFDAANYPPVAMLLTASLYPIFGDQLTFGRWLNFAAALLVAAFLVRFVRAESQNWRVAFLSAGLFLGSTFVYHWMPLYRVDLIGLAFTFAGVFCVWRWERREKREASDARGRRGERGEASDARGRRGEKRVTPEDGAARSEFGLPSAVLPGAAIVFFVLALYTKHSLFFAPAAAIAAIWLRDRRLAIYFAVVLGGIGGILFVLLEVVTRGGWSFGILALNATVWTPRVFVPLVTSFFTTYFILLGLAVFGWVSGLRRRQFGVLEIYALTAVTAIALAGREGAWENYFLEPVALACVFAGYAVAQIVGAKRWGWVLPLLLIAQLGLFVNEHDPRIAQKLFEDVRAGNERVGPLVRSARGTVIAEDMGLLWGNGKPVEYYSFVYSTLARAGRYDQKWETENLRAGNFPMVVLNRGTRQDVDAFGNFTHAFVSALDYGYAVTSRDQRYVVYEPAPLQHLGPRANFSDVFELEGWSLERSGESEFLLTVVWRALEKPITRYTTFAHLETGDGTKLAQDDHEPMGASYPTTAWEKDEMVREVYPLRLPATVPPGEYRIRVGWYDTLTFDRLNIEDNGDAAELSGFSPP